MTKSFKILLADDQPFVLEGLKQQLDWSRFHGVICGCVSDGRQALDFMRSCRPDVVISDIKMPHMDGIELARHIYESPQLSGIPVILLSGYRDFEYAKNAMQYHVNHYILKPITRQKLKELENILYELYLSREASHQQLLVLSEANYKNELSEALHRHDINRIEDFFQSSLYRSCANGPYCDIMGSQLITLLYDYLAEIQFSPQPLSTSKAHTLSTFYALPNSPSKANYVEGLYWDVVNALIHQKGNNVNALYRYALQYIDLHYTDPGFSISAMADEMNITLSYLSTLFKQSSGKNLNNYITEKRLDSAKQLLSSPHHSIREIAHMCGYEDPGYFSSLFRKKTGMNPTEYRNCHL